MNGPMLIMDTLIYNCKSCQVCLYSETFSSSKLQCHGCLYPLENHFTQVCINLIQKGQQTDNLQSATQVSPHAGTLAVIL